MRHDERPPSDTPSGRHRQACLPGEAPAHDISSDWHEGDHRDDPTGGLAELRLRGDLLVPEEAEATTQGLDGGEDGGEDGWESTEAEDAMTLGPFGGLIPWAAGPDSAGRDLIRGLPIERRAGDG